MAMKFPTLIKHLMGFIVQVADQKYSVVYVVLFVPVFAGLVTFIIKLFNLILSQAVYSSITSTKNQVDRTFPLFCISTD